MIEVREKRGKYQLHDGRSDEWLRKYNDIVLCETGDSVHHIIPRCKRPDLAKDEKNLAHLAPLDHYLAHYCLWKHDREFALEFLFTYYWFHKHWGQSLSEPELKKFKEDCAYCRKLKKRER